MRTNPAAFALSLGMGLIVLLIGFLALSAAGLVNAGPAMEDRASAESGEFSKQKQVLVVAQRWEEKSSPCSSPTLTGRLLPR